ncbi:hypothetical protein BU25DRAFT_406285 [Macroventuria anomochaeta]|uniref:Uncharacterized protein n=1 Tax=Macroventuria anomochaeta TaxID=301207 RepID=A0ACB6SGA8_9PLEO|nr:uncharacterized protein BU25DRAFT_406285 [Macroventuria anomochaeta]KAF2633013.1 hypothetical protein BU25DRAFT_406285 [Macroventuria anomochaeta]
MSAPEVTLPSLLWRRRQNHLSDNQAVDSVELARSPTWPAMLPSPNSVSHVTCSQPNLYLQLSQILEWEIWNHNQTRTQVFSEQTRCGELEAEIWRLSQIIVQWQETCKTTYAALDEHRMEHIKLVQELEATTTELRSLQEKVIRRSPVISFILTLMLRLHQHTNYLKRERRRRKLGYRLRRAKSKAYTWRNA